MGRRFALALTLTAALSTGCSLDVSGLLAGAGGASVSASAGGEGGVVSTSSSVTSSGTTAPCTKTGAEICNDGLDNDCNMAADCADPMCTAGFVCIPAIPSGWSAVAFSAQSRPACPAGYETSEDVVSAPSADSACACSCTSLSEGSCVQGTVGIASNGAGQCPASPSIFLEANGSSCGDTNLNTVQNGKVRIAPLQPQQGACSGTPVSTIVPPAEGRFCSAAAVGGGCADGGACVTNLSAPFASCIEHEGAAPCPTGFPNSRSVGGSATDMRVCLPCLCGTNVTCSSPTLTVYNDGSCMFGAHELPVTNACDPVNDGNGDNYRSFRYKATIVNPECQTTMPSTLTGSLVLAGERTICCQ